MPGIAVRTLSQTRGKSRSASSCSTKRDAQLLFERSRERGELPRNGDRPGVRRHPVSEAAVDRVLGGPEEPDRLSARVDVVQLGTHHRPQDATAAMRGGGADDGYPGSRDERAGNGELEWKRTRPADDEIVVPGRVHPLDREVAREALAALFARLVAEVLLDHADRPRELLEVRARPDGRSHVIFSSGA